MWQEPFAEDTVAEQISSTLKVIENCRMKGQNSEMDSKEFSSENRQLNLRWPVFQASLTKSFEAYRLLENLVLVLVILVL